MTHGHELRWGNDGGGAVQDRWEQRGEEKWDNYNNISIKYI